MALVHPPTTLLSTTLSNIAHTTLTTAMEVDLAQISITESAQQLLQLHQ